MLRKIFFLFSLVLLFSLLINTVQAQCSMCTINAEQGVKNGNTVSAGLNTGVLYLLAIPYLVTMVVGIIWYKKYKKKNIHLNIKQQPLNMN
jgi:hypothetical protein